VVCRHRWLQTFYKLQRFRIAQAIDFDTGDVDDGDGGDAGVG